MEHSIHVLEIVYVEEPGVLVLLVLVKGHSERVADVERLVLLHRAQQHSDHSLHVLRLAHSVEVVHHIQQHQRVHRHLQADYC